MKQPLYYGVKAYGFPGHCFPSRFIDSCRTLSQARQMARAMHRDGWRTVDVMREQPRPPGHSFGAEWAIVETIGA